MARRTMAIDNILHHDPNPTPSRRSKTDVIRDGADTESATSTPLLPQWNAVNRNSHSTMETPQDVSSVKSMGQTPEVKMYTGPKPRKKMNITGVNKFRISTRQNEFTEQSAVRSPAQRSIVSQCPMHNAQSTSRWRVDNAQSTLSRQTDNAQSTLSTRRDGPVGVFPHPSSPRRPFKPQLSPLSTSDIVDPSLQPKQLAEYLAQWLIEIHSANAVEAQYKTPQEVSLFSELPRKIEELLNPEYKNDEKVREENRQRKQRWRANNSERSKLIEFSHEATAEAMVQTRTPTSAAASTSSPR